MINGAIAFALQEHLNLLPYLLGGLEKTCLIRYQDVHSNDLKAVLLSKLFTTS